jgi:hypothetical protein
LSHHQQQRCSVLELICTMLMMPASASCSLQAFSQAFSQAELVPHGKYLQVACRAFTPGKQSNKRTGAGLRTLSSYYRQLWSKIKPQHVDAVSCSICAVDPLDAVGSGHNHTLVVCIFPAC